MEGQFVHTTSFQGGMWSLTWTGGTETHAS